MAEKKDRRSRVDRVRDNLVENIEARIKAIKQEMCNRLELNSMDDHMIKILREQIETIHNLCEKNGKGEGNGE